VGHFHCEHVLGVEPDKMTAEIYAEFLRTLAIAWACFAMGAALWHWRAWATFAGLQHCSKLLLLLSPVLLSAFGYRSTEAVRTAELLAQQPRARSVFDEAPRLVAEHKSIQTQGGTRIEYTRTRTERAVAVQAGTRRGGRSDASDRQLGYDTGATTGHAAEMPVWGTISRFDGIRY